MNHNFDIYIATKHGVNEAIFLNNMAFWIQKNQGNERHFYDGRYWTYNSQKAFSELFPYWSRQNIRTIIKSCIDQDLIIKGNYNKISYDQTQWYAFTESGLKLFPLLRSGLNKVIHNDENQPMHLLESTNGQECGLQGKKVSQTPKTNHWLESTNGVVECNQPIPDIKNHIENKDIYIGDLNEKSTKKKPKKKPIPIPDDFMYNEKHIALAKSLGLDINYVFEDFKDKAIMKGTEWICWNTAFMHWIRKANEFRMQTFSRNKQNTYTKEEPQRPRTRDFTQERLDREEREYLQSLNSRGIQ